MRRNSFLTFLKEKSFIIVLTLMLISAGTMAALFALGTNDRNEEGQIAKQEEIQQNSAPVKKTETKEKEEEKTNLQKTDSIKNTTDEMEDPLTDDPKYPENGAVNPDNAMVQAELEDQYLEAEEIAEVSASDVIAEGFSETPALTLQWPVEGEVILEFAMDHSIYFPTLAQYQYNPAMIIGTSEGTEVLTAAAGIVTDVGKTNEYGHYVTMDLGNGFELTYGQLFDISTEVGETLEAGQRIAMVAYPTRNYTQEGQNLYLALTKDGMPADPDLYLE